VEQINRELKTDLGLGEHQVSKEEGRRLLAYLLLIRVCDQEISPRQACSVSQLQHAFRLRVIPESSRA